MDVISSFAARFERTREEELSLEEYLAECKRNPVAYATAAERMLQAADPSAAQAREARTRARRRGKAGRGGAGPRRRASRRR